MTVDQVINLTPEDTIASVRERMQRAQAPRLILVPPPRSDLLRSPVSMKLLRRHAERMHVELAIISGDHTTQETARLVGIPVFSRLEHSRRSTARMLPTTDDATAVARPGRRWWAVLLQVIGSLGGVILLALGVLVLAAGLAIVAPRATIELEPAARVVSARLSLRASTEFKTLDSGKGQVPARPVQVIIEDVGQAETSGRKRAPDAAASGAVIFANRSLGAVTVPKGTIVRTSTGATVRFATEEEGVLPAGAFASVRVKVKAVEPGPEGNVKAGTVNMVEGAIGFQVNVLNDADLAGGTQKDTRYATAQDRNALRDAIVQKIRANSLGQLQKLLSADDLLPAETLNVVVNDASFDKNLGEEASILTGRVRATVSGLVISGEGLARLMSLSVVDQVEPGFEVLPETISYGTPSNVRFEGGVATLQVEASARSQAQIDPNAVRSAVVGQPVAGIEELLLRRFRLARTPDVTVAAGPLKRMPFLESRITVDIAGQN